MTALATRTIDGEILTAGDCVRVIGRLRPFGGARICLEVPAGSSVAEAMRQALAGSGLKGRRDYAVYLDDHAIESKNWERIRVKRGVTITFVPRLQGGGTLRAVLSIVVAVAALVFAGPLAGSLTIAGFAITGTALTLATAAISAGIMLAGTLALNALFPVRPPGLQDNGGSQSLNSIQGARNQGNPYGPVPVVLGRHRQSPFFAAKPYTEVVGDDQYLRLLFCLGYGPLTLSDFRIGETPLTSFSNYTIETREGLVGDAPVTLYPGSVDEVALSVKLVNVVDAPATVGSGGVWQSQTTAAESDEISLDFSAIEGCFQINEKSGNLERYDVYINIRHRRVGDVAWTADSDLHIGRSVKPARVGLVIAVARGQYEVQARKATGDGRSDKIKDDIVWTALRSIKHAAPIAFPQPLALVALRIKASDQLSGVVDTFNCICESRVTAWNGAVWVNNALSRNPADLFRHVLQGPANARPVADAVIDLANLQGWSAYCVANGFKFNQVVTSVGSVYAKLADIAAAGRAVVTFIDGKWGVIWDRPDAPIVQVFTPRNSWGFQGQKPYTQKPHGWRIKFINEQNGYTSDERIVYDDGYDETNATLLEGLPGDLPGVTDPDLVWKHGRFHIAQSRLRPEKFSLSVGWEHLVCGRGDRVRVTHDAMLIGLASGRVKKVVGQVVTFDELVTLEAGQTYGVQFRVAADARTIDRAVDPATPAGEFKELTLIGDLSGVNAGALFGFGKTGQVSANYRIQGIAPQKDLIATLTLVDDAPEIAAADSGAIPAYDPHVTIPADPFTLPPRDFKYAEVIDGVGASVRALVRLSWQVPRFGRIASFEVQQRDDDNAEPWVTVASVLPPGTGADVPLVSSGAWSYRVRCIFTDGTASDWALITGVALAGLSFAPGDITNLHQHSVAGQAVLDWVKVDDQRAIYYEVRKGTSWETGLLVGETITQPPWPTTGDGTYHISAYVLSPFGERIYSANIASITIADSIIARNILRSNDEQAAGWLGGLDGGVIDGSFIRTDVAQAIALPFGLEVVDQLEIAGLHVAVYLSPITVDIGRAAECRYWTEFEASGVLIGDDFLAKGDVLGDGDVLGTAPTRFIKAYPIWHFGDGENDIFAPADIFSPTDVFDAVEWRKWVATASGTRVSRYFKPGFVLISDDEATNATGTKFSWFVDVPDRTDDYTSLTVPDTGLSVTFYAGGYAAAPAGGSVAVPFNGGPNNSAVPHVQRAIVNGTNGDEVKISGLTLAGCTVHVVNAGVNVARAGVNLLVRGY